MIFGPNLSPCPKKTSAQRQFVLCVLFHRHPGLLWNLTKKHLWGGSLFRYDLETKLWLSSGAEVKNSLCFTSMPPERGTRYSNTFHFPAHLRLAIKLYRVLFGNYSVNSNSSDYCSFSQCLLTNTVVVASTCQTCVFLNPCVHHLGISSCLIRHYVTSATEQR
jgi:hypothetical protein